MWMSYEWKKIFSSKNKLLVVLVLAINLVLLILQNYNPGTGSNPQIYREIFREMEGMTNRQKYLYLKKHSQAESEDELIWNHKKMFAMEELAEDARISADYEQYIVDMEESNGKKIGISLFGGKNSYSQRNARKMQKVYQSLHGTKISFEPYKGIQVVDTTSTNILVLFLVAFLTAESLILEKEEGILILLRSCRRGRGWMLKRKISALTIGIFLVSGLFLLENLFFGMMAYGIGNLARPVQSLPGYEGCSYQISVFWFLAFIWILRSFGMMPASVFVLVLTVYTYQMNLVLGGCVLAGSMSYFCYEQMGLQSNQVFLHYVNPTALLKVTPLIKGEVNINFLGIPVCPLAMATVVGIVVYVGLILWLMQQFDRNKEAQKVKFFSKRKTVKKRTYSISIWGEEAYKLWVTRRGLLFLVLIFGVQLLMYPGRDYVVPPDEIYENYCLSVMTGEVSGQQEQWIKEEQNRLNKERASRWIELEVMEHKIVPLSEHLAEVKREEGHAAYIRQTGYEKLFGVGNQSLDRKNVLLYVLLLLVVVSTYGSMEKTTHMLALIAPTKAGWKKVRRKKQWTVVLFSVISLMAVWILDWFWIVRTYELREWYVPIIWLYEFRDARSSITIGMYAAALFLARLFSGVVVGLLMLLVSEKSRNGAEAYGINTVIFFVPAVLVLLGVPYVERFTFSAILDGNMILRILIGGGG